MNGTALVLARWLARKAVADEMRRRGLKPQYMNLDLAARLHLIDHEAELIAQAQARLCSYPYQKSNTPPARISPTQGQLNHDRRKLNHSKPNITKATAEPGLSPTRVPNREGGRTANRGRTQTGKERAKGCCRNLSGLQAWLARR